MGCPDEDEIVAYAQGHVGPAARERIGAHVDACEICVGLVAEAARAAGTRVDGIGDAAPGLADGDDVPGRGSTLGRYLVLDLLGRGGLGRVFSAYDPELDRKVAIKLLEPHALRGAADLRTRLVREAQALAKVRHPNVVAVHDVGVVGDQVFVAMELVDGTTLREWLLAKERDWTEIRDVFVAVARGLAAVHAAGLVHRDVKPTNILIGRDPQGAHGYGRVQVADLGLARALDRDAGAGERPLAASPRMAALDDSLTASGAVMGTPAYMAPEQHRGERVDARADQFGFCIALFEALHGTRPFAGSTSEQLFAAAASGAFVDVQARRVPGWLRRVALRGLAAEPSDRHGSMQDVVVALQHDRSTRRRRASVAALALVLGGAGLWGFVVAPALAPGPAARDAVDALAIEARAAAAKTHFVHPPPEAPTQPTAYTKVLELEALAGPSAALADARAAELRDEFATTLVTLGDRFWNVEGGTPFAAEYYAAALVFDDDHPHALARVGVSVAAMVALRERAAALSFGEPELVAVAPVLALASEDDGERMRQIEAVYARTPEPPVTVTAALEPLLGEPGRSAVSRGRARRSGPALASAPRPAAAVGDDRASVGAPSSIAAAAPRSDGPRSPVGGPAPTKPEGAADHASARAHASAGRSALGRGDLTEAAAAFHRALAADRKDVGALAGLAEVYFQRRAYETSAKFLERALALAPRDAELHLDLGDVYFKVLRYKDARSHYDEARSLGHTGAARRLQRLDERLGAAP